MRSFIDAVTVPPSSGNLLRELEACREGDVVNFAKERDKRRPVPTTDGHVSLVILHPDDPELQAAWTCLAEFEAAVYRYDTHQVEGEQWQYMGTEYLTEAAAEQRKVLGFSGRVEGQGYYHCFRIRWHPVLKTRVYFYLPATLGWKPSYEDVLTGKRLSDNMKSAVAQMAKDHPDVFGHDPNHNPTEE